MHHAPRGKFLLAEGCSLLVAKENQKTTSDFAALSQKAALHLPFSSTTPPREKGIAERPQALRYPK